MQKEELKSKSASAIAKLLRFVLKVEANTTSSLILYQPKAPSNLKNYR